MPKQGRRKERIAERVRAILNDSGDDESSRSVADETSTLSCGGMTDVKLTSDCTTASVSHELDGHRNACTQSISITNNAEYIYRRASSPPSGCSPLQKAAVSHDRSLSQSCGLSDSTYVSCDSDTAGKSVLDITKTLSQFVLESDADDSLNVHAGSRAGCGQPVSGSRLLSVGIANQFTTAASPLVRQSLLPKKYGGLPESESNSNQCAFESEDPVLSCDLEGSDEHLCEEPSVATGDVVEDEQLAGLKANITESAHSVDRRPNFEVVSEVSARQTTTTTTTTNLKKKRGSNRIKRLLEASRIILDVSNDDICPVLGTIKDEPLTECVESVVIDSLSENQPVAVNTDVTSIADSACSCDSKVSNEEQYLTTEITSIVSVSETSIDFEKKCRINQMKGLLEAPRILLDVSNGDDDICPVLCTIKDEPLSECVESDVIVSATENQPVAMNTDATPIADSAYSSDSRIRNEWQNSTTEMPSVISASQTSANLIKKKKRANSRKARLLEASRMILDISSEDSAFSASCIVEEHVEPSIECFDWRHMAELESDATCSKNSDYVSRVKAVEDTVKSAVVVDADDETGASSTLSPPVFETEHAPRAEFVKPAAPRDCCNEIPATDFTARKHQAVQPHHGRGRFLLNVISILDDRNGESAVTSTDSNLASVGEKLVSDDIPATDSATRKRGRHLLNVISILGDRDGEIKATSSDSKLASVGEKLVSDDNDDDDDDSYNKTSRPLTANQSVSVIEPSFSEFNSDLYADSSVEHDNCSVIDCSVQADLDDRGAAGLSPVSRRDDETTADGDVDEQVQHLIEDNSSSSPTASTAVTAVEDTIKSSAVVIDVGDEIGKSSSLSPDAAWEPCSSSRSLVDSGSNNNTCDATAEIPRGDVKAESSQHDQKTAANSSNTSNGSKCKDVVKKKSKPLGRRQARLLELSKLILNVSTDSESQESVRMQSDKTVLYSESSFVDLPSSIELERGSSWCGAAAEASANVKDEFGSSGHRDYENYEGVACEIDAEGSSDQLNEPLQEIASGDGVRVNLLLNDSSSSSDSSSGGEGKCDVENRCGRVSLANGIIVGETPERSMCSIYESAPDDLSDGVINDSFCTPEVTRVEKRRVSSSPPGNSTSCNVQQFETPFNGSVYGANEKASTLPVDSPAVAVGQPSSNLQSADASFEWLHSALDKAKPSPSPPASSMENDESTKEPVRRVPYTQTLSADAVIVTSTGGRQRKTCSDSDSDDDEAFERFIRSAKSVQSAAAKCKVPADAPLDDFIVDDDFISVSSENESNTDEDSLLNELEDLRLCDDKENQPKQETGRRNRSRPVLQELPVDDEDDFIAKPSVSEPNITVSGRMKSDSDVDNKQFATPAPRRNLAVLPQTVSHCQRKFSFLKSLSQDVPDYLRDVDASRFVKKFSRSREELTKKLFLMYNREVFGSQLPDDLPITWNQRLTKTAGFCRYKSDPIDRNNKTVSIELSVKVCDSAERLRDTLIHELCHAVVWIVHKVHDGHGSVWKFWVTKANRILPDLPPIRRCHAYEIHAKYLYTCSKCGYQIPRHSKSLDTESKACGYCGGTFNLCNSADTPRTQRTPNKFALFVKQNYSSVKRPGMQHKDVMSELSSLYAAKKDEQYC